MKRIKLIATGGTIAGTGTSPLDLKDYVPGKLSAEKILDSIPEAHQIAKIDAVQFENFGSSNITTSHWILMKKMIEQALNEDNYDGIVITHGTNTMEETAYFLNLTLNCKKPVVLVGSQRPYTAISSDAQLNLYNAIKVASFDPSGEKGVLIVLNDSIHSARDVMKTNTYRVEAFNSGSLGNLGFVEADNSVNYYRKSLKKHTYHSSFSKIEFDSLPNVLIVYSYAGSDSHLIDLAVNSGRYSGIVLAGMGGGHATIKETSGLLRAIDKGIIVVRSNRVGSGKVVKINNENWDNSITADNLSPQKARILLMLSLLTTKDLKQIQQIFNEY